MDAIEQNVKSFIIDSFLPGADPSQLTEETPLITGGILDSLATVQLSIYLEQHFHIEIGAHETGPDNLNTLAQIAALVRSKRPA
ncbi:MAG: acyl carrier protein [Gemmatimonadaceae bacterium]|nr:acyl carrier protein [Gemmatimonadaceae bacterium]